VEGRAIRKRIPNESAPPENPNRDKRLHGKAEPRDEDMRICPFSGADAKCDACADK